MTHGFEAFNYNEERILDYNKALYISEQGTTRLRADLDADSESAAASQGFNNSFATRRRVVLTGSNRFGGIHGNSETGTSCATSAGTCYGVNGKAVLIPLLNMGREDTSFYKISSKGLLTHNEFHFDFPGIPQKGFASINSEDGVPLPYRIVSPNRPVTTPTDSHGMQVFDSTGNLVFDSRQPIFTIFQVELISQTIVKNILDNGASHTITLKKAAPNCWVATPFLSSFKSFAGSGDYKLFRPLIKQTNSTTITITRNQAGPGRANSFYRSFDHPIVLFIARDV
jgi:hypothetical protein